jgi:hypothetical protein
MYLYSVLFYCALRMLLFHEVLLLSSPRTRHSCGHMAVLVCTCTWLLEAAWLHEIVSCLVFTFRTLAVWFGVGSALQAEIDKGNLELLVRLPPFSSCR